MKRKVAIQGIGGCNHYIAARDFFCGDEIENIDCDTFSQVADNVAVDPGVLGVMAVENTIAGSILQNYRIIREKNLVIVGEYKLRISHSLVALKGTGIEDIKEINSHPMAFMQCENFLVALGNVKLVEKEDTAGSAKWIKDNGLKDHAAICPSAAAKMYGLEVLAEGIETNKCNFTRFLVVANKKAATDVIKELYSSDEKRGVAAGNSGTNQWINKSSIVFTLPHVAGSLSKVLSVLSFYDMNLSMIQSLPIVGKEWEYQFYINVLFEDYGRYLQAVDAIMPLCSDFKIMGEYADGRRGF
ncbi:MAG: prephenate dehydratase [Bacteroidales bacterium]|jgi:prephenate dehydratase|nr:prephenate dehydratase [Bacteroidales bacterium]